MSRFTVTNDEIRDERRLITMQIDVGGIQNGSYTVVFVMEGHFCKNKKEVEKTIAEKKLLRAAMAAVREYLSSTCM